MLRRSMFRAARYNTDLPYNRCEAKVLPTSVRRRLEG